MLDEAFGWVELVVVDCVVVVLLDCGLLSGVVAVLLGVWLVTGVCADCPEADAAVWSVLEGAAVEAMPGFAELLPLWLQVDETV